jgi:hypothetical protein
MKNVKINGFVVEISKIESAIVIELLKEFNNRAVVSIETIIGKIERM